MHGRLGLVTIFSLFAVLALASTLHDQPKDPSFATAWLMFLVCLAFFPKEPTVFSVGALAVAGAAIYLLTGIDTLYVTVSATVIVAVVVTTIAIHAYPGQEFLHQVQHQVQCIISRKKKKG